MSAAELTENVKDLSLHDTQSQAQSQSQSQQTGSTLLSPSPDTIQLKHPLNTKWTLWYTKPPTPESNESWSDLLKPVITFGTVEEFWGIFNSIPSPKTLPLKGDYHLFRDGIKPEWEDPKNSEGGKWTHQFSRKDEVDINDLWLRGLLALIGETIQDDEDEVNGIVLNNRKFGYRVGLWTKTTIKRDLMEIGDRFKKVLKLENVDTIEFYSHKDAESVKPKPTMII